MLRGVPAAARRAAERCPCERSQRPFDGNSGLPWPCRIGRCLHSVELCHTPSPGRPHEPAGLLDRTVRRHVVGDPAWDEGQHLGHAWPRPRDMRSGAAIPGAVDAQWPGLVEVRTSPVNWTRINRSWASSWGSRAGTAPAMRWDRRDKLPLGGRLVLHDGHIDGSPGAKNTGGLNATHAHREPCTPAFKFADELQCLRPPRIRQDNLTAWSE